MATPREPDALLTGGPRNDTPFNAEASAIVELELEGPVRPPNTPRGAQPRLVSPPGMDPPEAQAPG